MNETLTLTRPRTNVRTWRTTARRPWHNRRSVDVVTGLAGLGLGITVALGVTAESWSSLNSAAGWLTAGGRRAALVGTYLMLIVVLLAGRVPIVERAPSGRTC